jgi:predicted RNase H-like HicB family nuclease
MKTNTSIELTAVFMEDDDKSLTGFFSQFPEAFAGGDTIEEVEQYLFNMLPGVMEVLGEINQEEFPKYNAKNIITRTYSYQPAFQNGGNETNGNSGGSFKKRLSHLQATAKRRWNALFFSKQSWQKNGGYILGKE